MGQWDLWDSREADKGKIKQILDLAGIQRLSAEAGRGGFR